MGNSSDKNIKTGRCASIVTKAYKKKVKYYNKRELEGQIGNDGISRTHLSDLRLEMWNLALNLNDTSYLEHRKKKLEKDNQGHHIFRYYWNQSFAIDDAIKSFKKCKANSDKEIEPVMSDDAWGDDEN